MKKISRKSALNSLRVELDCMERAIKEGAPKTELLMRVQMMRETISKAR